MTFYTGKPLRVFIPEYERIEALETWRDYLTDEQQNAILEGEHDWWFKIERDIVGVRNLEIEAAA